MNKAPEFQIEHRAPETYGVNIKRSPSRLQQRATDFIVVTIVLKYCATLSHMRMCVFIQYPQQVRH